jgi:hypothetical protein
LNMGLVLQALRKTKTLTYQLVLPILKRFFPTTTVSLSQVSLANISLGGNKTT